MRDADVQGRGEVEMDVIKVSTNLEWEVKTKGVRNREVNQEVHPLGVK